MPKNPTYGDRFKVDDHPDDEYEVVPVEEGIVDGATEEERAVVAAHEQSSFSHVETLEIREVKNDG